MSVTEEMNGGEHQEPGGGGLHTVHHHTWSGKLPGPSVSHTLTLSKSPSLCTHMHTHTRSDNSNVEMTTLK